MAVYVIDASVVMNYFIADAYTAHVEALFDKLTDQDRLIVPEFCLAECANVLWKHVRFHGLPLTEAEYLIKDLQGLPLLRFPIKKLIASAFRLGVTHQIAIYDAIYIALADRLRAPLITVDHKQAQAARAAGITLKPVEDF